MSFTKPEFPPVDPDTFLGLVGQQYLADPQRSVGNIHPVSAYAHVPNGSTRDLGEAVTAQVERFGQTAADVILGVMPFNHVGGLTCTLGSTLARLARRAS